MRAWVKNLVKVKDTPEALARGLAVGFFFGVSFFWGLQIALSVLVSHLVRGNKVVAAAATAVSNPLTSLPLYSLCYLLGHLLTGGEDTLPDFAKIHSIQDFLALGPHFFITMLIGTTIVGGAGAVILYFSSSRVFDALRLWHDRKTAVDGSSVERKGETHPPSSPDRA
jgi:uncharacterized protein (DUF2062 family)